MSGGDAFGYSTGVNGRDVPTTLPDCGGCRRLGAHSPRCHTQPGAKWRRLADRAKSIGDEIGANDMEASSTAWRLAALLRRRASGQQPSDPTAALKHQ